MNRYSKSKRVRDETRKRRISTSLIPFIPIDESDVYIITTSVERLDLLADRFYGDATLWWIIASANNVGKGTMYVKPNTKLRIPQNTQSIQEQIELFNVSR